MRTLIGMLLALAVVHAGAAEGPAAIEAEEATWRGRTRVDVERVWGEPSRVKGDGRGGTILIYKIRLLSPWDVRPGGDLTYDDVGVGPSHSPQEPDDRQPGTFGGGTAMTPSPGTAVVGKRKARFFIDAAGKVYDSRIGPMKWNKNYRPEP